MLKLKTFGNLLTENVLIDTFFSNISRENQWTAAIFYLYDASYDLNAYKKSTIMDIVIAFFRESFFNWTNENSYIVDAMALRILWEFYGFNVLKIVEEKEKNTITLNRKFKSQIAQYALHIKYSFLKSFKMANYTEVNINEEITDWIEKIGERFFVCFSGKSLSQKHFAVIFRHFLLKLF
jgi:hypothetical protein